MVLDDELLVARCLDGDQAAFTSLVSKYKEMVHAYAYYKLGSYQEAEDITQEVFIKAYRKLKQLRCPHRFQSWLYSIAANECKMWLRRRSAESFREISLEDVSVDELNGIALRSSNDEEINLTVNRAMETLSDDRQLVLSLFYMSSLSIKQIAYSMSVSPNSVGIKLHRARKQLGERVEKMIGREKKVKVVGIPDLNLAAAIREAIGKPDGDITEADLQSITELEAPDNSIRDITGIERCVNLEKLILGPTGWAWWISNNEIEDISPLKGLTKLTHLNLRVNEKTDIDLLSSLTNLTLLWLSKGQISEQTLLPNLSNLTHLRLSECRITSDELSLLSSLTNLDILELPGNKISDVKPLSNLTNLTSLGLGSNKINDVTPLSNFTNLTGLDLSGNRISDVTPLSNLTNLTVLVLHHNQISDVTPLSNLTDLTELHLGGNQISDVTPLSNLTKLTELHLPGNQIDDIAPLSNLTNLTFLWVPNLVTDASPLVKLTNLTRLRLHSSQISDWTFLSRLTNLEALRIDYSQIRNVSVLSNLTDLTSLHISGDQVTDLSPLAKLTNLTRLVLDDNAISDITPLSSLPKLTLLNLNGNQISDIAPLVENKGLGAGDKVDLEGNLLNDEAYEVHIPALAKRGVGLKFDPKH